MILSQIYVKLSASKAPSLILPPLKPIKRNQASTQKSQKRRATEGAEVPGDPGGLLPVRAARGLPAQRLGGCPGREGKSQRLRTKEVVQRLVQPYL